MKRYYTITCAVDNRTGRFRWYDVPTAGKIIAGTKLLQDTVPQILRRFPSVEIESGGISYFNKDKMGRYKGLYKFIAEEADALEMWGKLIGKPIELKAVEAVAKVKSIVGIVEFLKLVDNGACTLDEPEEEECLLNC